MSSLMVFCNTFVLRCLAMRGTCQGCQQESSGSCRRGGANKSAAARWWWEGAHDMHYEYDALWCVRSAALLRSIARACLPFDAYEVSSGGIEDDDDE